MRGMALKEKRIFAEGVLACCARVRRHEHEMSHKMFRIFREASSLGWLAASSEKRKKRGRPEV